MKILALSDLHASEEALDRLRARSAKSKYDLVLFCGDITTRGPVSYAEEVLSIFPHTYAVFGNMDSNDVVGKMSDLGVLINGRKVSVGDWNLVGIGGSNPTPFGTPNEFSEEELAATLASAGVDSHSIVLSHSPPLGLFDEVPGSLHIGSRAVRAMVESKKPLLLLCGHVHEWEGQEILGETLVVKLGAGEKLRAAEIDIGDRIDVRFISL